MLFHKLTSARALYQTSTHIWVAKGMRFYALDYNGKRITRKYCVGSLKDRLLSCHRLTRQLLRVGIHHIIPLKNGNILVTAKRKTYIVAPDGGIVNTWNEYQGNKPGHQGICITPDGTIFFAEYLLNPKRDKDINLWRSTDNGMSFHIVKTWPAGDIRHLHFVKWDEYEDCLWLGTGDYGENNKECRLYRSDDNGKTWNLIGQGSQDWRAIGLCFTPDYLVWGTDAGSCPDKAHLVRMSRKTHQLEVLEELEGPCHGCATYADGRIFIATGVESGENEKDRFARLKEYKNNKVETIAQYKKDFWPEVLQIGCFHFPSGSEKCNSVVFTAFGLTGYGETTFIENK